MTKSVAQPTDEEYARMNPTERRYVDAAYARRQEREQAKPQPAVGQVWRYGDGRLMLIIKVSAERRVDMEEDGSGEGYSCTNDGMSRLGAWSCVGISTAHGRVMVGERWRDFADNGTPLVVSVIAIRTEGIEIRYDMDGSIAVADPADWFDRDLFGWEILPSEPTAIAAAPVDSRPDRSVKAYGHHDERERGPGIARLEVPRPTVAADVVHTWEDWTVP